MMLRGATARKIWKKIWEIPFLGRLALWGKWLVLCFLPKSLVVEIYRQTDWKKLDQEIESFLSSKEKGIAESARMPKIIVSLTSYPARIPRTHYTIFTLLTQSFQPDKVILWLGEELFPNRDKDLPAKLLAMQDHGLSIRYTRDIKSHTKLIPALAEFPDEIIITVDDDLLYDYRMVETLVHSYEKNTGWIHAQRAHQITVDADGKYCKYTDWQWYSDYLGGCYRNFFLGGCGTLYPPHSLHEEVSNERLALELTSTADDIWFWAMAVLKGTKTCIVEDDVQPSANFPLTYEEIFGIKTSGLTTTNVAGGQNDLQFKHILERYPAVEERLRQELKSNQR